MHTNNLLGLLTAPTRVGSGDLGIKDVKSIIKSGKSKRSHIRRLRTCSPHKPARAEAKLTRRDFLISNRTAQIFARPTNQLKPKTNLDA
jgi:hypothetical protein